MQIGYLMLMEIYMLEMMLSNGDFLIQQQTGLQMEQISGGIGLSLIIC